MCVYKNIIAELELHANQAEARHLMRFFKTAPGEYGEGDKFLGLRVPFTRSVVKEYRGKVEESDISALVESDFHEIRLAGFLLLIELYIKYKRRGSDEDVRRIIDLYLSLISRGNNWDLVDLVAPKILGDWLVDHCYERVILDRLAAMEDCLWHQRVAIVSTYTLICNEIFDDTKRIAIKYLTHTHDLIHKATGWMLREMGKRGGRSDLEDFLEEYRHLMPRTMLRYAIEHFDEATRKYYLSR